MVNATNNLKKFNYITSSLRNNEKKQEILKKEQKDLSNEQKILLRTILKESPELFVDALYKWAKSNPIEAISYMYAYDLGVKEIYFKNDSSYQELFNKDGVSIGDRDITFTLYDKKTLESRSFYSGEIVEYFSRLDGVKGMSLELELLNGYKIDLIKEKGKFIDEQNWTIEFNVVNSIIPKNEIIRLLKKNFSLDFLNFNYNDKKKDISFSKDGISEFIASHSFKFFGNYSNGCPPETVYLVLSDNTPVGLIDFSVYEDTQKLYLEAIEFMEECKRLGYGTRTIEILQTIFPTCDIEGYSGEDEDRCAFFSSIGANYLSCEEYCDEYGCSCDRDVTGDYGCDEPYDYKFVMDSLE